MDASEGVASFDINESLRERGSSETGTDSGEEFKVEIEDTDEERERGGEEMRLDAEESSESESGV